MIEIHLMKFYSSLRAIHRSHMMLMEVLAAIPVQLLCATNIITIIKRSSNSANVIQEYYCANIQANHKKLLQIQNLECLTSFNSSKK